MDTPAPTPTPPNPRAWTRKWLGTAGAPVPSLALPDVLWFFGAISGAAAAISIVDHIPESHRDLWEFLASLGFLAGFALCAWILSQAAGRVPGGLVAAMAAAMVPAAGYGFTRLIHVYPQFYPLHSLASFNGAVFGIALATALAALIAYALTRVAVNLALAVAAVIFAAQVLAAEWHPGIGGHGTTEIVTGSALTLIGLALDAIKKRGEAFWAYLGGLLMLTVGLVFAADAWRDSNVWVAMLFVGTALVLGWPFVVRRTWLVFGVVNLLLAFGWSQATSGGRGGDAIWIGAVVTGAGLLLDAARKHRTAWWVYLLGLFALLEGFLYLTIRDLAEFGLSGIPVNPFPPFPGFLAPPSSDRWIAMLLIGAVLLAGFVAVGRKIWVVFGVLFVWGASTAAEFPLTGGIHIDRSLIIACVVLAVGLLADLRKQRVTGFWLQLWGLNGIAGVLIYYAATGSDRESHGWIPMLITAAVLLAGASIVQRKLWVVFGAAGVVAVFGHDLVSHSGWFRYVLLGIGLVVFVVGLAVDRARSGEPQGES